MWALIEGERVVELTDIDPAGRYHESLVWVQCKGSVQLGMQYADGKFSAAKADNVAVTTAHVEAARLIAYADPINGSDRLFVEATRMQMTGESGWESVRDQACARHEQIKKENPWP